MSRSADPDIFVAHRVRFVFSVFTADRALVGTDARLRLMAVATGGQVGPTRPECRLAA